MNEKSGRLLHWTVKVVITAVVGCLLAVCTHFFRRMDSSYCWGLSGLWSVVVGTSLYRFEGKDWQKSALKGFAVGVLGWIVITAAGFLYFCWAAISGDIGPH